MCGAARAGLKWRKKVAWVGLWGVLLAILFCLIWGEEEGECGEVLKYENITLEKQRKGMGAFLMTCIGK
jgi:hypothetical protein